MTEKRERMSEDDPLGEFSEKIQDVLRQGPGRVVAQEDVAVDWFDTARIRPGLETEGTNFAGRVGVVHGFTVPSETGVGPVIGEVGDGAAINVHFDELNKGAWFAPELVEPVEGDVRTTSFSIGGVTFNRAADGGWEPVERQDERRAGFISRLMHRLRQTPS
jgi:hypothetical protein